MNTPQLTSTRLSKSTRETSRLLDSLGGGLETNTPRSARSTRNGNPSSLKQPKTQRVLHSPALSVSLSLSTRAEHPSGGKQDRPILTPRRSDSSLSDLSDHTIDHHSSGSTQNPAALSLSQSQSQTQTQSHTSPSSSLDLHHHQNQNQHSLFSAHRPLPSDNLSPATSLPPTPNRSMKAKQKPSLRKTIIKRSHSSHLAVPRNPRGNPNFLLNKLHRRLTEAQKKELEQTRLKLLENLQQEEELIRSSQHPILISLEENVEIAKKIRMAQAKHKFEQLGVYLDRLLVERQQRIWDTWKDAKIRLHTEMTVDCQIRLNRAPFEFLISNDTTNLQAIFHLTPTPPPAYHQTILSINRPDLQEITVGSSTTIEGVSAPAGTAAEGVVVHGGAAGVTTRSADGSGIRTKMESGGQFAESSTRRKPVVTSSNKKTPTARTTTAAAAKKTPPALDDDGQVIGGDTAMVVQDSLDIIQGLRRQRIRNHAVWQLSHRDIRDDLKSIQRNRRRHQNPTPIIHHPHHHHPYSHPSAARLPQHPLSKP
ncbi:hypothetical protein PCANC_14826 [Puccinia coronata f. sp. avenae]|uniref:Uncharacterized protein n=1 Tax=Puccinia coronata f. sp. avenae TaxID=200324 RepID=A0A2N5SW51_9BASI|nr:hypothetical protein PCANC_14826 [Puccinia coronata f. sp. avenae]